MMNGTILISSALALAYLKEGLSSIPTGDETLGEKWALGGDFEVTMHLLEEVVPVAIELLAETNMDDITQLYEFYGQSLPEALFRMLPETPADLEACITLAIEEVI